MICPSCELDADPSKELPFLCVKCTTNLPHVTKDMYRRDKIKRPRLVSMSRERNQSVREIGGGKVR